MWILTMQTGRKGGAFEKQLDGRLVPEVTVADEHETVVSFRTEGARR